VVDPLAVDQEGGTMGAIVLARVPVLDPASFIGLRANGLTASKIDDFSSKPSH